MRGDFGQKLQNCPKLPYIHIMQISNVNSDKGYYQEQDNT